MTDKKPMPQQGGSYIRQADGSLVLESRTEDAAAPIGLAEAEQVGDAGPTAKPRKPRRVRPPAAPVAEPAAEPAAEPSPPGGAAAEETL